MRSYRGQRNDRRSFKYPGIITLCALSFGILIGVQVSTSALVFYNDDRRPSKNTMVGILEVDLPGGTSRGTAVLVDDCGILTNFHVAFGPWFVTELHAPSPEFVGTFTLPEVLLPDGRNPTAQATPVLWGDYLGPDRFYRRPHEDWTYLVLSECLGNDYGHFSLRPLDIEEIVAAAQGYAGGFTAIGYSTGSQMADTECSVVAPGSGLGRDVWLHDCALQKGDSGGPIIEGGTLSLVALGSGMRRGVGKAGCNTNRRLRVQSIWGHGCTNIAVPISWQVIERIRSAEITGGIQLSLAKLGYDADLSGTADTQRAKAAIGAFQRDAGMPVTEAPSHLLLTQLRFQSGVIGSL